MRYRYVVVGAGVMGSATARALARGGGQVLLLEQFSVGHKHGSSHGASRIFRLSYPESSYVGMAVESLALWREAETELGRTLLTTTGGLDCGRDIAGHVAALESRGASFEMIDAAEVASRWPEVRLPEGSEALFQPDGGWIAADDAVRAFVDSARSHGAQLVEEARVETLVPGINGVKVRLAGGDEVEADVVVVTAGAWARPLLATAGIELDVRVTRETVAHFSLEAHLPSLVDWTSPAMYALHSPGAGLKVGEHIAGPEAVPDSDGAPDPASLERLTRWVRETFPAAGDSPLFAETCLYTNTFDQSFVLERHGDIIVGSPCSGHGFKFAPLIGQRLASLAST